jgi:hypothetical protein
MDAHVEKLSKEYSNKIENRVQVRQDLKVFGDYFDTK